MKLQQWISVASYQPEQQLDEDEFDGSGTKTRGLRVLTCTFEEDRYIGQYWLITNQLLECTVCVHVHADVFA